MISGRETKMNEPRSLLSKTHGPLGERDKVVDSCRVIVWYRYRVLCQLKKRNT